jgi:hypothetical protein
MSKNELIPIDLETLSETEFVCDTCGSIIIGDVTHIIIGYNHYCSDECANPDCEQVEQIDSGAWKEF